MKLAFVVQRCGEDIRGGAESVCLNLAKKLSKNFEIEILTTCAKDYVSWKNHYPEGIENLKNISIRRFKVDQERDLKKFNKLSEKIYFQKHTREEEEQWMKLQGPYSTNLINFVNNNHKNYDGFVFFTYLYATTYYLLPIVYDKSFLVPFAHDEPPLNFSIYEKIFRSANALIFSTKEEENFILNRFEKLDRPSKVVGIGVDPLSKVSENFSKLKIDYQYILYLGRVDQSKGCDELVDYFLKYVNKNKSNLKLVLAGPSVLNTKNESDLVYTGEVDEATKSYLLHNCVAFVMPSKFESFSIAIMEAWLAKKPVIVNEKSTVLKGHCEKSNAGLYYGNFDEFKNILDLLLTNSELKNKMGESGYNYVQENYNWNKIIDEYSKFIISISEKTQSSKNLSTQNNLSKKIITFVIPWYGKDLHGGAENQCRRTVESLFDHGQNVEVLTTCSKQFLSDWTNFYKPGIYDVNRVVVRRFEVDPRDITLFDKINFKLMNNQSITKDEEYHFIKNSINSRTMLNFIDSEKEKRVYIFIPYMFGTTYNGCQISPKRSIMIPCFHDESYAYMKIFKESFPKIRGMLFNSVPEKNLAEKIFEKLPPNIVAGEGVDNPSQTDANRFKKKFSLKKFLLYTGRKDPTKNVPLLIDYYCKYVEKNGLKFDLVLTGPGEITIPEKYKDNVKNLMLSKEDLYDAYSAAFVTCQPSLKESFSLSIMESWLCSTPVLVHENCDVTKEHCIQSNGGLYFSNYDEFESCINFFLENPDTSKKMAQNGKKYVQNNFDWNKIIKKYLNFLKDSMGVDV